MSEEPKARPSINLDELERQLREASRNQAFRKTVSDQNSNSDDDETGYLADGSNVRSQEDFRIGNRWSDDSLGDKIVVSKGVNSSFEQIEAEPELRGPPPFLMGSRDDRFPEVGSGSDTVTGTRSWRSIFLIAFSVCWLLHRLSLICMSEKKLCLPPTQEMFRSSRQIPVLHG